MSLARILVATCLLGGASALAGPTPTPTPAQAPAKEAKHITIKFQGTLREALKAIADKGGINLIITGELSQPGEVYLTDVPADQALQIVADAHALKVRRQGSIWTIRPLTAEERARQEAAEDGAREGSASPAPTRAVAAQAPAGAPVPAAPPSPPDAPEPPAVPDAPEPPDALDEMESLDPMDAPDAPDAPSLADGETPDPVADPKGFQRHIEERVQRDLRAKLMRKFRNKRFDGSGKNDMVGTGHVVVEKNQTVGTVVSFGGGLDVKGHVEGDAVAFGGGVRLGSESEVEGDVVSFGGSIVKEDGAEVGGEEVAFGGSGMGRPIPISISSGHNRHEHRDARPPSSNSLAGFLAMFAVLFGGGFLSMMFAPNRMKLLEAEIRQEPLRCGLIGLLGAFGLPILTVMLVMTVVGILLVPVLWVVVAVGCLMGIAALANQIGTRLPLKNVRKTQAVVLALGVLLLELVGLIPVVGALAWCAVFALSLGAIIRSRFGTRQLGMPVPV